MVKHLERAHTEKERDTIPESFIRCTTCDALFYNKKAYDNHNMFHKPDDLYVVSEEQRLQTVSRVDQDFDIRRVQLSADKFIPIDKPKQRRQNSNKKDIKIKEAKKSDDELSPTSSIDSSDSDSDDNIPLKKLKVDIAKSKSKAENNINVGENSKENVDALVSADNSLPKSAAVTKNMRKGKKPKNASRTRSIKIGTEETSDTGLA